MVKGLITLPSQYVDCKIMLKSYLKLEEIIQDLTLFRLLDVISICRFEITCPIETVSYPQLCVVTGILSLRNHKYDIFKAH